MAKKKRTKGSLHVSLDRDLIKWVEEQSKSKRFRSKSHAVEIALELLKQKIESGEPIPFDF